MERLTWDRDVDVTWDRELREVVERSAWDRDPLEMDEDASGEIGLLAERWVMVVLRWTLAPGALNARGASSESSSSSSSSSSELVSSKPSYMLDRGFEADGPGGMTSFPGGGFTLGGRMGRSTPFEGKLGCALAEAPGELATLMVESELADGGPRSAFTAWASIFIASARSSCEADLRAFCWA